MGSDAHEVDFPLGTNWEAARRSIYGQFPIGGSDLSSEFLGDRAIWVDKNHLERRGVSVDRGPSDGVGSSYTPDIAISWGGDLDGKDGSDESGEDKERVHL